MNDRVLVVSPTPLPALGQLTPGSGARAYEMSRALARAGFDVTVAAPGIGDPVPGVRAIVTTADGGLPTDFGAYVLPWGEFGGGGSRPPGLVIVDAYDLSLLSYARRDPDTPEGRLQFEGRLHRFAAALLEADVVLHAGRAGRHFVLGALTLLGRIAPGHPDPGTDLLDVPLGAAPPPRAPRPLVLEPPIPADAEVVLWPSGTYAFFDALRALEAFERVAARRDRAHLLIAGGVQPGGSPVDASSYDALVTRARASPFADRIRFAPWQPYLERGAIYAQASAAIVLTRPGPEDELSWRNRVLDALAAGVPVIVDGESEFALRSSGSGCIRVERTVEAAADAIERLLAEPAARRGHLEGAQILARSFSWDACAAPLVARLREEPRQGQGLAPVPVSAVKLRRRRWGDAMHRLEVSWKTRGPVGFVAHGIRRAAGRSDEQS